MPHVRKALPYAIAVLAALAVFGFAGVLNPAQAEPESAAIGLWSSPTQGWVVETKSCGNGICGFLVSFLKGNAAGPVVKDSHNPDPLKRNASLCGLKLLGGFTPSEQVPEKWEKGWVYDPETGSTYTGGAQIVDTNTIRVRGYVIIPLFGRTITLVRATGTVERCSVPPQSEIVPATVTVAVSTATTPPLAYKQH